MVFTYAWNPRSRCAGNREHHAPEYAHTVRHSTACHLLRAGNDINTIRGWLGHVSLDTTNVYAEIDLQMKAEALAKCEITAGTEPSRRWRQPEVMAFLRTI